jgi:ubiquinone/menaquinone biosynthesis C-methylase UbiE
MPYCKYEAQAQFESWSATYDHSILQRLLFTPSHNCLIDRIDGTRSIRILDIGCGTGVFAKRIGQQFSQAEIWAVDLARGMLDHASRRSAECGLAVNWVQADSESLPLVDNSFDVITCANSFHHYPNQQQVVREMYRVLRPDGRLMIIDGYRDRLWGRIIYDWCVVAMEGAVHHASANGFHDLFVQAGFHVLRQQVKLGLAPFLLTTGVAIKPLSAASSSPSGRSTPAKMEATNFARKLDGVDQYKPSVRKHDVQIRATKFPPWMVVCLLTVSVMAPFCAGVTWWIRWPERTARTCIQLMIEGGWEEASHLMANPKESDYLLQIGQVLRIQGYQVPPEDLLADGVISPYIRSWSDVCLGRQSFGFGETVWVAQRDRIVSLGIGFD